MYQERKFEEILEASKPPQSIARILRDIEEAIQGGKSQRAYELSLQATQIAPDDASAWFLRASLAPTLEERILCVNRLNELDPTFQDRHNVSFFTLKELIDKDPFLVYLEESDDLYRVLSQDRRVLSIPKKRSVTPPPPHKRQDELRPAHRWLGFAILGLMFAGLLTLIFAPLAAWSAILIGQSSGSHKVQIRSSIVVLSAIGLFIIGLLFAFLFVLHVTV